METKTTPELIEEARVSAERSLKWTAEKSGIALSTFNRKMRGGADFTIGETLRVAKALGVEPFTLLPTGFLTERVIEELAVA